jgi:DNA-binding IclR family transcriptional regulator
MNLALSSCREAPERESADFVASLARGLAVVRAFGPDAHAMTLTQVAARTKLTRAAARRFLLTLQALGYAESDGKHFRLTAKVLDLGYAYLSSMDLWDVAQPHMERLVAEVQESCSCSVLDGTDIVYVLRVPTKRIMSVALSVGTRLPAYATSMGRVLLAAGRPLGFCARRPGAGAGPAGDRRAAARPLRARARRDQPERPRRARPAGPDGRAPAAEAARHRRSDHRGDAGVNQERGRAFSGS